MYKIIGTKQNIVFRFFILCIGLIASWMNADSGNTFLMVVTSAASAFFVMELLRSIHSYYTYKRIAKTNKKAED